MDYLNPIYKDLDDIHQRPQTRESFPEETNYIEDLLAQVKLEVQKEIQEIDRLQQQAEEFVYFMENETGDDRADAVQKYNKLLSKAQFVLDKVNQNLSIVESAYFGKLEFQRTNPAAKKPMNVYIGKFAYFDQTTLSPLITDWRAPIANLYYEHSGLAQDVTYTTPMGEHTGDIQQRRQFEITRGAIDEVYETTTGNAAADAFLLSTLEKRDGSKLKDIVSTIQAQQNSIIRAEIDKPIIIQGVAGSGKTTILLHRLAYIFYAYKENFRASASLVIAPNKMFVDYISDVLPSLGITHLPQTTYLEWAKSLLGFKGNYVFSTEPVNLDIKQFKGSAEFINLAKDFYSGYIDGLARQINDRQAPEIFARFNQLYSKENNLSIIECFELAVEYVFAQIQFKRNNAGSYMGDVEEKKNRQRKILNEIKRRLNPIQIYKEFLKEIKSNHPQVYKYTMDTFGKKGKNFTYTIEDLTPLAYFKLMTLNREDYIRDLVVVDEAQDHSPFTLYVLGLISKNRNITIAGDIAQSIIPPFQIMNWKEDVIATDNIFKDTQYFELNRCYRTTIEIIDYVSTNLASKFPKGYVVPEAVLRHGAQVEETATSDRDELLKRLTELVNQNEFGSLAVVTRDSSSAEKLQDELSKLADKEILSHKTNDFKRGVIVLPVSKSKGLEFDNVIVIKDGMFGDDLESIRLLYVACTRALHTLKIFD